LFAIGKVELRRRFSGTNKNGQLYTKKVFDIRGRDGTLLEVADWNDSCDAAVGADVVIPVKAAGNITVFSRGGEEF
jgi:hypothetical protein